MNIDPGFWRRLKFYLVGFGLGMLMVSIMFKGRAGCKMPATVKLEELQAQEIELTKHVQCRMKCRSISTADVARVLVHGSINYDKSNVQDQPCGTYAVEGKTNEGKALRIIVADCDTISRLVTAIDLGLEKDEEKCGCK
jgi:hypothetical protein